MNMRRVFIGFLVVLSLFACKKSEPVSATDPLPLPEGMEANKDLSINPGDSFYDYCNGTWLRNTPVPAAGAIGGMYDQTAAMSQRVEQLKSSNPDIGHFAELMDAASGQPERTKDSLDAQKARFPRPQTMEEAFVTMGRMMADGINMWANPLIPTWNMIWKDGRLMGSITPYIDILPDFPDATTELDPAQFVPLAGTKAGEENSAASLMIKGMGEDPSLFVTNPQWDPFWERLENRSLEELLSLIDDAWAYYEMFGEETLSADAREAANFSIGYTLSYHFAQMFLSPALREKYMGITKEIQASLRKRIQQVDWMSETTRNNALEKLDCCGLNVACPDQWHTDCVPSLKDCSTLAEAVHLNNRGVATLKHHLLGGTDVFSFFLTTATLGGSGMIPVDLTMLNSFYSPGYNCIYIFPAFLLPPIMPENVSLAYEYAVFMVMGHEFTHGFDSTGSQYDKWGNKRNWWTVADKMAFEERRDLLVACYNHLEYDPERAAGMYSDGDVTQTENIADLGGFLAVLDAYEARLDADGYFGEVRNTQLRKFFESFADLWRVQYSDAKLATFPKNDTHSHARLRVNGVVMNTDLWYDLYNIDRNSILYLPKERRTYIW